ncbi:MAG: MinD/ParA family protein [Bacilli bacterium]
MMYDQAALLRQQMAQFKAPDAGCKVIGVISGKGGVGKSNVSLNTAVALRQRGKRVLLCDFDIGMGNIDLLAGVNPNRSIVDVLELRTSLSEAIVKGPAGVDIIAGGTGLTSFFQMSDQRYTHFLAEFEQLLGRYDLILFDFGASITDVHLNFLRCVDDIFAVTTPEPPAITDVYAAIKYLTLHGANEQQLYLICNRADTDDQGRAVLHRLSDAIGTFLARQTSTLAILPDDRAVRDSVYAQIPYLLYRKDSRVARATVGLVDHYLGTWVGAPSTAPETFVDKLRRLFARKGE